MRKSSTSGLLSMRELQLVRLQQATPGRMDFRGQTEMRGIRVLHRPAQSMRDGNWLPVIKSQHMMVCMSGYDKGNRTKPGGTAGFWIVYDI